ncbi:hypothetical protein LCGC14_2203270, partial [marine sediment metagenome]
DQRHAHVRLDRSDDKSALVYQRVSVASF